jgi:signal transduction histidine kinase
MDCSGTILLANRAAQHFFRDESLAGRSWFDVCPGLDSAFWNRVLRENGWIRHEAEVNGVWFVFAHRRDGDFVFAYGADITARKQDERLLAEQAAALALMARFPEMNPGPVLRLGRDANILLANAAARAVFGMEGLVGRCWKDLCPGMNEERWRLILAAPDIVFVDAQIGPCSFVFAHRKDGDLVFVFGADVTQQRTAEQLLRQTEKMATLGTLAAGVAHELNNPLSVILGYAKLLRAVPGPHADDVAIIESEARQCQRIVSELLDLARPHRLDVQPVDLATLAREAVDRLDDAGALHGRKVEVIANAPVVVPADAGRIRQVIANVVVNAAQATAPNGKITIDARSEPDAAILTIADDGQGIPADVLAQVFDPFVTTKAHGTGLGLAIAHAIVDAHGGRIWIASSTETGTRVSLQLPASPSAEVSPP